MKFQVKTTALAILVSLGVVGCKSNDTSSQKVDPTPINQPEQPQPQPEQPQPQPEQPQPQPEQPQPQPEQPQPQPEQPQPQPEQPQPQPEQPQAQPSIANKLDKNGEPWRHIKLTGYEMVGTGGAYGREWGDNQGRSQTGIYYSIINTANGYAHNSDFNTDSANNNAVLIDIDKHAPNQGVNTGVINDDSLVGNVSKLNYEIVNQPYSSYGVLFTDNSSKIFTVIQSAGAASLGFSGDEPSLNGEYTVASSYNILTPNKNHWNDSVAGEAVYKGDVFAHTIRGDGSNSIAKRDGTVTINANFVQNGKSYVTGTIKSDLMGEIALKEGTIDNSEVYVQTLNYSGVKHGNFVGDYAARFGGKDLNDVVGNVSLQNDKATDTDVKVYEAVFGATKQPK